MRIIYRDGVWFGFIKRRAEQENVYFDNRGYKGDPGELVPDRRVTFELGRSEKGLFARNVSLSA